MGIKNSLYVPKVSNREKKSILHFHDVLRLGEKFSSKFIKNKTAHVFNIVKDQVNGL